MQLTTIALALACATSLMASSLTEKDTTNNEYIELFRQKSANGSLVYLGPPSGTQPARLESTKIGERSSCQTSAAPSCSTDYTARNDICDSLITELGGDPQIGVGISPRQICYEGASAESDKYCCVSWHDKVPNLVKGDLAGPASSIMQSCTSNGISGKISGVMVYQTCTTVCLSDRGTGC